MRPSAFFAIVFAACATIQEPPGGPPDFAPPVLLQITPDSGSVLARRDQPVVISFNEVINERPGADLDQMVLVSPRPRELSVSWRRDEIAVRPGDGWRDSTPYRVTLLPGISDLRNNRLLEGRTVLFSTGGPIPDTRVTGRVVDWEAGTPGARALVELIRPADSLVFWDLADSTGAYALAAVPPGDYVLAATLDKNNNRRRDPREPFDSARVRLDSALVDTLWAFVHDTTGPRIRTTARGDSVTIRVEFNQPLHPGPLDSGAIRVRALPDSTPVPVTAILTTAAFDSLRAAAAQAARPDSAAGVDSMPADSARAPADTARTPVLRGARGQPAAPVAVADSAMLGILRLRPRLSPARVVRLAAPLVPGGRYVIDARVRNPTGAVGESTSVLVLPEAAPDSTPR
jgi:hypothetical protein